MNKLNMKKYSALFLLVVSVIVTILLPIFMKNAYVIVFGAMAIGLSLWQFLTYKKIIDKGNYITIQARCIGSKITALTFGASNSKIYKFKPIESKEEGIFNPENKEEFELQIALTKYRQYSNKFAEIKKGDVYNITFKYDKEKEETPTFDNTTFLFYEESYVESDNFSSDEKEE